MTRNTTQNPEKEWFGERHVAPAEKTRLVEGVFAGVARRYDLMNDLMSGGLHRLWKDSFARAVRPRPGETCLDVAGGTGDIAFRLRAKTGAKARIAICDLSPGMLEVGRSRAIDRGWLNDFEWVSGNAEALPFPDCSFDIYTIAFGLRNVTHIDTALAEAARVLKPGGRFHCLEFSRVRDPLFAKLYDAWSFGAIPKIGQWVAQDRDSYQYLVESIRKFPSQKKLAARIGEAGFKNTGFRNFSAGIVAHHYGVKV